MGMAGAVQSAINLEQASYRRFRAILAERTRPVILWCGAGLSVSAGLPDWSSLKELLINDLELKAFSFEEGNPQRSQLIKRVGQIEAEQNAWISFTQLKNELGAASFKESIREHLTLRPSRYFTGSTYRLGMPQLIPMAFVPLSTICSPGSILNRDFSGAVIFNNTSIVNVRQQNICRAARLAIDYVG